MNLIPRIHFLPGSEALRYSALLCLLLLTTTALAVPATVMDGVPPTRESQATFKNYRDPPLASGHSATPAPP